MRFLISLVIVLLMTWVLVAPVLAQGASQATLPFPTAAKFGYADLQQILASSEDGVAANQKVQEFTDEKLADLEARNLELQQEIESANQQLEESQQKLTQSETVMSAQARLSLQRDIQRLQLDIQRQTQDAQAEMERITQDAETEVGELQQQLQIDFETRLQPAIEAVAAEKEIDFLFNVGQGGLVWANPSLDLTQEIVDKLNSLTASAPPE